MPSRTAAEKPRFVGTWVYALAVLWGLWVLAGVYVLTEYSAQAGEAAEPPQMWPQDFVISRDREKLTLVMLVHPHCPCSRASIGELAELMSGRTEQLDAHVFFVRPAGFEEKWEESDLWQSAERIVGVQTHADPHGASAARLGAKTSGQAVLFDRGGRMVFAGGITPGRGHMGDSSGTRSIIAAIASDEEYEEQSAVYGCDLFDRPSP